MLKRGFPLEIGKVAHFEKGISLEIGKIAHCNTQNLSITKLIIIFKYTVPKLTNIMQRAADFISLSVSVANLPYDTGAIFLSLLRFNNYRLKNFQQQDFEKHTL